METNRMIYQPAEELLAKAEFNVYKLSTIAFHRAQEIANGQPKLIDAPAHEKITTTALREIIAGKVVSREYADAAEKSAKKKKKDE
jgi:DNA-directed RNA polymerase omega subunit